MFFLRQVGQMDLIQWTLCISLTLNIILLLKLISIHRTLKETEQRCENLRVSVLELSLEYYEVLKYLNEREFSDEQD